MKVTVSIDGGPATIIEGSAVTLQLVLEAVWGRLPDKFLLSLSGTNVPQVTAKNVKDGDIIIITTTIVGPSPRNSVWLKSNL